MDYRLLELKYLCFLERKGCLFSQPILKEEDIPFGMTPKSFKQMLINFLFKGYINGRDVHETSGNIPTGCITSTSDIILENIRNSNLETIRRGNNFPVEIGHLGKIQIARLGDELRRLDDDFGILWRKRCAESDWEIAWKDTPKGPVSLLFCDLDNFGQINKKIGHLAGDSVLRNAFSSLKDSLSKLTEAYRFGGDEVVIIITDDQNGATEVAERIRKNINKIKFGPFGLFRRLGISIGGASFYNYADFEEAIKLVDNKKTEAKIRKNCVVF